MIPKIPEEFIEHIAKILGEIEDEQEAYNECLWLVSSLGKEGKEFIDRLFMEGDPKVIIEMLNMKKK